MCGVDTAVPRPLRRDQLPPMPGESVRASEADGTALKGASTDQGDTRA